MSLLHLIYAPFGVVHVRTACGISTTPGPRVIELTASKLLTTCPVCLARAGTEWQVEGVTHRTLRQVDKPVMFIKRSRERMEPK